MYKLISVCLALSLVFSETNTIKNKRVEKLEQTELKKAKSSAELEFLVLRIFNSMGSPDFGFLILAWSLVTSTNVFCLTVVISDIAKLNAKQMDSTLYILIPP